MTKYPTYGFDKTREQHGKGFDGDLVRHVLDYYFPEWHHNPGESTYIATGKTDDGRKISVYLPQPKTYLLRVEIDEDGVPRHVARVMVEDDKSFITKLWRLGDAFDTQYSDSRFFQLVQDYSNK